MENSIDDIIKFNLLVSFINNNEMNTRILSPRQFTHEALGLFITDNSSILSLFFIIGYNRSDFN